MRSLPDIYRNVAVGGFIHWESVDYLEPEAIGFQKLFDTPPTDDYRYKYKNGYPLYQKTRDAPQISEFINLDRNLSNAVYTREGAMTLSITNQTLNDFDTLLRDVRTNYEMLPDDKRREVNPALIKTLVPQQFTDEQKANIMRYGRAYGLTDEQKVQEYLERANQVALRIFPELQEQKQIANEVRPEQRNEIDQLLMNVNNRTSLLTGAFDRSLSNAITRPQVRGENIAAQIPLYIELQDGSRLQVQDLPIGRVFAGSIALHDGTILAWQARWGIRRIITGEGIMQKLDGSTLEIKDEVIFDRDRYIVNNNIFTLQK